MAGDSRDADGRKIFVGGIAHGVEQQDIRADFGRFGEIEDVYLPTDRDTGRLRGFGFVTFRDPRAAEEASREMHGCAHATPTRRATAMRVLHASGARASLPGWETTGHALRFL